MVVYPDGKRGREKYDDQAGNDTHIDIAVVQ